MISTNKFLECLIEFAYLTMSFRGLITCCRICHLTSGGIQEHDGPLSILDGVFMAAKDEIDWYPHASTGIYHLHSTFM